MSDILTVEVDMGRVKTALALVPKELKYYLGDEFDHSSLSFLKKFRRERLSGRPGVIGIYGKGNLFSRFHRASLVPQSNTLDDMGMRIWTDSEIAKRQEEGGVVKAELGRKLAVPLSKNAEMFTSRGKLRAAYRRPGLMKNIIRISGGSAGSQFLAKWIKRAHLIKRLFILKEQTVTPPRLQFFETWASLQNERIMNINRAVDKALKST